MSDSLDEGGRGLSAREPSPLHFPELVRNPGFAVCGPVDYDWHQEGSVGRHQMGSIDRELPLQPEIPLRTGAGIAGYDWDKKRAGLYLLPDGRIPSITAAQLALVEPYLDAGRTQALADPFSGLGVFGRIAEEDGSLAASG
jgi:hypothetical protein